MVGLFDDLYPPGNTLAEIPRMLSEGSLSRGVYGCIYVRKLYVYVRVGSSYVQLAATGEKCLRRCRTYPVWGSIGSPLKSRRRYSSSWSFLRVQYCVSNHNLVEPDKPAHVFPIKICLCTCCNNSEVIVHFVAFSTRLFAVLRFESVIHEFDP